MGYNAGLDVGGFCLDVEMGLGTCIDACGLGYKPLCVGYEGALGNGLGVGCVGYSAALRVG